MTPTMNVVICGINAYGAYTPRDMAGGMRVRNIFDQLTADPQLAVSNLVLLDLQEVEHNDDRRRSARHIPCLSIGYSRIYRPRSVIRYLRSGFTFLRNQEKAAACNVLYNYDSPNIRNIAFVLYCRRRGFKIVFDIPEDDSHKQCITMNDKIRIAISRGLLLLIRYYADAVFAVSTSLVAKLQAAGRGKVPVQLLPVSVDVDRFAHNQAPSRDEVIAFYGGTFAPKDGVENLIAAVEAITARGIALKLVLTGEGHSKAVDFTKDAARRNPCIQYKGRLDHDKYLKVLEEADICCVTRVDSPFANSGFPFKLGEFLAAGKVVIASESGDISLYLRHLQNAYLVSPGSVPEIIDALEYCVKNIDHLRNDLGRSARETARRHFDAADSATTVRTVLANLCCGRESRRGPATTHGK